MPSFELSPTTTLGNGKLFWNECAAMILPTKLLNGFVPRKRAHAPPRKRPCVSWTPTSLRMHRHIRPRLFTSRVRWVPIPPVPQDSGRPASGARAIAVSASLVAHSTAPHERAFRRLTSRWGTFPLRTGGCHSVTPASPLHRCRILPISPADPARRQHRRMLSRMDRTPVRVLWATRLLEPGLTWFLIPALSNDC